MLRTRSLFYRFAAQKLGLNKEEDKGKSMTVLYKLFWNRAKNAGKLADLQRTLEE